MPATSAAVVYVSDLSEDTRYPRFGAAAMTADIRTVLACPLSSEGMRGALNLYARLPNAFGATDRAKGTILAALAGAAIASTARRADLQSQNVNLQATLVSREMIGQAQGILMERERVARTGIRHPAPRLPALERETPRRRADPGRNRRVAEHR